MYGKRNRRYDGRYSGMGGGLSASNTLRNSPPNDQTVSAVSHAVIVRGLRVMR